MQNSDFPALYAAADAASDEAQRKLARLYWLSSLFLIAGALCSICGQKSATWAMLSAILFLISLALFVFERAGKLHAKWYEARALAESIKTSTWRLVMGADPFSHANEATNLRRYRELLLELLTENKGIAELLGGQYSSGEQLTNAVLTLMRNDFATKRGAYFHGRIVDQRAWYAAKSALNLQNAKFFFWLICAAYIGAVGFVLLRVAYIGSEFPSDAFAVVATSLIGWTKLRRYDELASAYSLTAHEVGIIAGRFEEVEDMAALAKFVSDAENAFSREHTQWAARRDH